MSIIRMNTQAVQDYYNRTGITPNADIQSLLSAPQAKRKAPPIEIEQPTRIEGRPSVIELDLPYLLPTLNDRQKTGWAKAHLKKHWIEKLQNDVMISMAMQYGSWVYAPYAHAWIVIERVSAASREPDHDNLSASAKELVDVLQPMHPTIRPYGLGIIAGDHPQVLHRCIKWRRPQVNENQHTFVTVKLL
jgi:hypothetical protein